MRAACSTALPCAGGSAVTPIWRSSLAIVRTSMRYGTLLRRSGCSLSSAAHMMGSAAFFAPEMRTSPSSGRPPRMRSLSTGAPLFRGQRAHGERVDLLAHAAAERGVHHLVALHAALAREPGGDHHGLEVLAVADHLDVLALQVRFDALLDAVRRDHQCLSLYPDFRSPRLRKDTASTNAATIARLAPGGKSDTPKKP